MESQEYGEVMSIDGPLAKIKVPQHGGCASCVQHVACFPAGRNRILMARVNGSLKEGDGVMISTASAPAVISSLLVFIGPIVLGIAVWFIGNAVTSKLWITILAMILSFAAYFITLTIVDRRLRRSGWFLPRAVKCDAVNFKGETPQK